MSALKRYRLCLFLSIVLNLVVGLWIFVSPESFTGLLGQPDPVPNTWPRHWGAQLWAINFLYMPGYRDPLTYRWPNWCGIWIRIGFALFFFSQGGGFTPMGIYDGISGVILLGTYLQVTRSADKREKR